MLNYVLGIDVGTRQDHSALVLARRVEQLQEKRALPGTYQALSERPMIYSVYEVPLMERLGLGIEYRDLVNEVRRVLEMPELWRQPVQIVMDATGVGWPVMQQMLAANIGVIGVTITGGTAVGQNEAGYTVPKRDLVSALQVVAQNRRLKVAAALDLAEEFEKEISAFRRHKPNKQETWDGEGEHDDIVMAAAIAIWYAERAFGYQVPAPLSGDDNAPPYNPLQIHRRS